MAKSSVGKQYRMHDGEYVDMWVWDIGDMDGGNMEG